MAVDRSTRTLACRFAGRLFARSTLFVALGLVLFFSLPAHASEAPRDASTSRSDSRAAAATNDGATQANRFERLRQRLLAIPLRPVKIGTTPRLPTDPEPGMGVVVRIPF